jgi:hypothetical protein
MGDIGESTPAKAMESARRGRKSETAAQRLERLATKEAEQRMSCVVGEALLAEAKTDSALKSRIVSALRKRVTTEAAKADIAGLLAG